MRTQAGAGLGCGWHPGGIDPRLQCALAGCSACAILAQLHARTLRWATHLMTTTSSATPLTVHSYSTDPQEGKMRAHMTPTRKPACMGGVRAWTHAGPCATGHACARAGTHVVREGSVGGCGRREGVGWGGSWETRAGTREEAWGRRRMRICPHARRMRPVGGAPSGRNCLMRNFLIGPLRRGATPGRRPAAATTHAPSPHVRRGWQPTLTLPPLWRRQVQAHARLSPPQRLPPVVRDSDDDWPAGRLRNGLKSRWPSARHACEPVGALASPAQGS